jgi:hypothetical protein
MGSVFFIVLVLIVLIGAGILATPFFFIPAAALLFFGLVAGPIGGLLRDRRTGGGPSGVPTTEEASYDPVQRPEGPPTR